MGFPRRRASKDAMPPCRGPALPPGGKRTLRPTSVFGSPPPPPCSRSPSTTLPFPPRRETSLVEPGPVAEPRRPFRIWLGPTPASPLPVAVRPRGHGWPGVTNVCRSPMPRHSNAARLQTVRRSGSSAWSVIDDVLPGGDPSTKCPSANVLPIAVCNLPHHPPTCWPCWVVAMQSHRTHPPAH